MAIAVSQCYPTYTRQGGDGDHHGQCSQANPSAAGCQQLRVADAQSVIAPPTAKRRGQQPEQQVASDCPNGMLGQHPRLQQPGSDQSRDNERQREHVRQAEMVGVYPGQRQEDPAQQGIRQGMLRLRRGEHGPSRDGDGGDLHREMEAADRRPAPAAAATQPEVARQGNQVVPAQRPVAGLAAGSRVGDRPPLRQAADQHAEQAAGDRREQDRQERFDAPRSLASACLNDGIAAD